MANLNIKFNNKTYSIDSASLADATATLEAHLTSMMEERLEGDGAEYYTLAPTALSFRSTAPLNELQEVQINGVTVDPSNYTLEEGSTIVKLKHDYLSTLDKGKYEVAIVSDSKTVKGDFSVKAPELNEHGFYYNQPYAAYMDYFNSDVVMFIREDNTMDIMVVAVDATETATYAVDGGVLTIISPSMGELHCTFSTDGMELYNMELGATLRLNNGVKFAADNDYIYIYKEDLGGYEVIAIDKTKAEYGAIKTGINGIDTVKLADEAFVKVVNNVQQNPNLVKAPKIPNTVYSIGNMAFRNCTALVSVEIPDSVREIGRMVFAGCVSLVSTTIPDAIGCISEGAFSCCDNLTSIIIGEGITGIRREAFWACEKLESITFKNTMVQWNCISKENNWNSGVPATHVHCTDGDVAL